jgi:hypothetical protein
MEGQQGSQHRMSSMPSPPANAAPSKSVTRVPMLHSLELTPFVDELPIPQRIAAVQGHTLRVAMREIHAKVHRDVELRRIPHSSGH